MQQTFEKALLAAKEHRPKESLALLTECIKAKPEWAEAWAVRGSVVHAQGDAFGAVLHYEKALAYNESLHDIWCSRGVALTTLGMWEAAEASFRRSIELYPKLEPYTGLGGMYLHLMRLPEAEKAFRESLRVSGSPDAHCNLGLSLLGQRKWSEAWPHYYYRHERMETSRARKIYPQWKGEGGRVLLFSEQGFGDEIMALRYAREVWDRGNQVFLEVRPQIMRLARAFDLGEVFIQGDPLPKADFSCALLDVPMVLGTDPGPVGKYLHKVSEWTGPPLPEGFKVGICWQSGKRHLIPDSEETRRQKSIPFKAFRKAVSGITLINLQKEHDETLDFFDPMPFSNDFADTACVIDQLDLVISVDTAVAHLAGAMGKPVWNLVRFNAFWPWSVEWYESMRVFRQPTLGDWETPLKEVASELKASALESLK